MLRAANRSQRDLGGDDGRTGRSIHGSPFVKGQNSFGNIVHHPVHVPFTNIQQLTFFASAILIPYCYREQSFQNQNHSQRDNMHSKVQNLKRRAPFAKNKL